ncbi:MAG: hypothetical protein HYZ45_05725 [Burkholderiales bacterium]|nr:hypothetical protein [Burkholderiales bacterium]
MPRPRRQIKITLPDEMLELCQQDQVEPEMVLRGFIADLCGIIIGLRTHARMATAATVRMSAAWRWTITAAWAIRGGISRWGKHAAKQGTGCMGANTCPRGHTYPLARASRRLQDVQRGC